jgi:hypothetical protein
MCLTACCLLSRHEYIGVDIVAVALVLQRTELGCMFHLIASQVLCYYGRCSMLLL